MKYNLAGRMSRLRFSAALFLGAAVLGALLLRSENRAESGQQLIDHHTRVEARPAAHIDRSRARYGEVDLECPWGRCDMPKSTAGGNPAKP